MTPKIDRMIITKSSYWVLLGRYTDADGVERSLGELGRVGASWIEKGGVGVSLVKLERVE